MAGGAPPRQARTLRGVPQCALARDLLILIYDA